MKAWFVLVVAVKAAGVALLLDHHLAAGLVLFFGPDPWVLLQYLSPTAQGFGPAATSFETDRNEVWLTIDDGPDPGTTPRALELLRAYRAKATFFVVGERVARHPELVRRIAAEGHTLANHTQTHPSGSFWCASPARLNAEIDGCVAALLLADVPFERFFRPPVGIKNPFLARKLEERGMQLVLWNARGLDGVATSAQAALARVSPRIRPGGIVLAHEAGKQPEVRIAYLELLLEHLQRTGYTCVLPRRVALRR